MVTVQDAGIGIDPNTVDQLFSAFFTTKPGGIGYGALDQPVDHRSAWRTVLGDRERGSRRHLPLRAASDAMTSAILLSEGSNRCRRG